MQPGFQQAFADESGNTNLAVDQEGVSRHYVFCVVWWITCVPRRMRFGSIASAVARSSPRRWETTTSVASGSCRT